MTLRSKVVCDACQRDSLLGTTHLVVGVRPSFPSSTRDMHFCDPTCLSKHLGNLQAVTDAHARAYRERGENIRQARSAAVSQ